MGRTGKYGKYKKKKLGPGLYQNARGQVFAHTRRRSGYEAEHESESEPESYHTPDDDELDLGEAHQPADSQADMFDTQADVGTYLDTQADFFEDGELPSPDQRPPSPEPNLQEDLSPPPTPEPVPRHSEAHHKKRRHDTSSSDEGLAVSPVRGLSPVRLPNHAPQLPAWAGTISEDELPPARYTEDNTVYLTDAGEDAPAPTDDSEV